MSRTSLFRQLKASASIAGEAASRNITVEQVMEERAERNLSRREFLKGAVLTAATLAVPSAIWNMGTHLVRAETAPRIAIIGAGLAGLTCAYRLQQAGFSAKIYEASNRIGGRCWSIRNKFADGQIAEHGGELLDSNHDAIIRLTKELGLQLDNVIEAEKKGTESLYYFEGKPYTFGEATQTFHHIWDKLQADVTAADYPTQYNQYTPRGLQLDHMSIIDWINESVPGGMSSQFGKLLDVAYNTMMGGESSEQSALGLLYLLGYSDKHRFDLYGPSDEMYHVRGGNDQIPTRLAKALEHQIQTSSPLVAIHKNTDDSYRLSFTGSGPQEVIADIVVLALPFSVLRTIDYSRAGFRPLKETAITEIGMGTNTKLALQFDERLWEKLNCNGATFADTGYQQTWEVSRAQPGKSGILVNFTGGDIGASFNRGTAQSRAKEFLRQFEPVLPGISAKWNGIATLDYWTGYKWTNGSYSYYKVGQYTKFAGIEREAEGQCYFVGEHTSLDSQGYLNGAVDSAELVATALIKKLKARVMA